MTISPWGPRMLGDGMRGVLPVQTGRVHGVAHIRGRSLLALRGWLHLPVHNRPASPRIDLKALVLDPKATRRHSLRESNLRQSVSREPVDTTRQLRIDTESTCHATSPAVTEKRCRAECTPGIVIDAKPVAAGAAVRVLEPDVRAERRPGVEGARLQILHDHLVAPDPVARLQHRPVSTARLL